MALFNQIRRYTAEAMNATGMQAGMPKVRVNASEVQQLLERYDRLDAENQLLRNALKEIADGEIYPQEVARAALYA